MIIDDYIGSVHVKTDKPGEVARVFEEHAKGVEKAFVAPPLGGWSALYPREGDSSRRWAELISRSLTTSAIAFQIIEDEVFCYQLFIDGTLVDEYTSRPAWHFGESDEIPEDRILSLKGKPQMWEQFLINGKTIVDMAQLLSSGFSDPRVQSSSCDYVIPTTILEDLCAMVGIKGAASTYDALADEIQEYEEDAELCDDEDDPTVSPDTGLLTCGRHARELKALRAPRRAAMPVPPAQPVAPSPTSTPIAPAKGKVAAPAKATAASTGKAATPASSPAKPKAKPAASGKASKPEAKSASRRKA